MAEIATLPVILAVVGTVLMISEALVPGAHLIVLGVALLGAGLTGMAFGPLSSPIALALLAIVYGAVTFYFYRKSSFFGGRSQKTSSSTDLKGAIGRVTERVTSTSGEVKLDIGFSSYYTARSFSGEEIPEGTEVIVIDPGGGNVLKVEALEEIDDLEYEDPEEIRSEIPEEDK